MARGPVGRRPPLTGRPTLDVERRLWRDGHRWVAGLDEVGRGAWAGPVSVGVAVVHAGCRARSMPAWLRDSHALAEGRREGLYGAVAAGGADGAVGRASAAECDRFGMTAALRLAAHRALATLEVRLDALVVDGPYDLLRAPRSAVPGGAAVAPPGRPIDAPPLPAVRLPGTVVPVVDGDARCAAVAAASVLAKVVRDRLMRADAEHYPHYGFERNKGYPSPAHQTALRGYGLSAIHRRSWAYVAGLPWR